MAEQFQVGDVVKLKSGGPDMTIVDIGTYSVSIETQAKCRWFDGNKSCEGLFALPALEKV